MARTLWELDLMMVSTYCVINEVCLYINAPWFRVQLWATWAQELLHHFTSSLSPHKVPCSGPFLLPNVCWLHVGCTPCLHQEEPAQDGENLFIYCHLGHQWKDNCIKWVIDYNSMKVPRTGALICHPTTNSKFSDEPNLLSFREPISLAQHLQRAVIQ